MREERLYCPIHGDYLPKGSSSQCPECRVDPVASSASLRQVRVLDEEQLDPGGTEDHRPTPVGESFDCPVCGTSVPASSFRVESAGEVWQGEAAVWAEEGVCSDCYRDVVAKNIREWTHPEWLVHHYEGWRKMAESVHEILVYEDSPQESWLPEEERHRILDVEATLASRREHMARCQMAMEELQGRYDAKITPPPFQMTMASASQALNEVSVEELKRLRQEDLQVEMELRQHSVYGVAPLDKDSTSDEPLSGAGEAPGSAPTVPATSEGVLRRVIIASVIALGLVGLGLLLVLILQD
ncbi:MAG: hypothetical protein VX498_15915 [Myxococcota bacterium]|nr:hypothetical protein [Myxococcota bacterium]